MDNPAELVRKILGLNPKFISSIPQENVLNTRDKMGDKLLNNAVADAKTRGNNIEIDPSNRNDLKEVYLRQKGIDEAAGVVDHKQNVFDRIASLLTPNGGGHNVDVLGAAVSSLKAGFPQAAAEEGPTPTMQQPIPTPTLAQDANDFEKMALPILNKYDIPPSVGFGMGGGEGGNIGDNNVYNINAVDSDPSLASNYATPEDGVEAFAKLIAEKERYKKAYDLRDNPEAMLKAIAEAGYAGDMKTWKKRSIDQARAVGKRGAGEYYDTYPDFIKDTPGYKRYIKQ